MLVDPDFAEWITTGGAGPSLGATSDAQARFTAYVGEVHRRATALTGPTGAAQLPWPRALGTPPWGVCRELETVARPQGTRYRAVAVRWASPSRRTRLLDHLSRHIGEGRPGALFVGSRWLPRHVALIVPGDPQPMIYDPGRGTVSGWDVGALSVGRADIGGWPQPWWLIAPVDDGSASRPVRSCRAGR